MEKLYQKFGTLLRNTNLAFKRYLYDKVSWGSGMIGIVGPRGVGKTTMILQYIKENLNNKNTLFVFADDMYFSENKLMDLADNFYKNDGEYLFIDEIHKYENWSQELKNIYDSFPTLKVVFTGSSVLDIIKGSSDLSRRAIIYKLQGLSFREFLKLFHNFDTEVLT
ncbi:MAG TPA: AAA family ATPase, partial [Candidatus Kapabacteria bacterium]|nr:AAA family ATPase [Candidatus Kapabacteria bacterium]